MDMQSIQFTKVDGENKGELKMFALSTCGWCKKTKAFLGERNIAYEYVDVDLLPEEEAEEVAEIQMQYNPRGSFPTMVIDESKVLIGFDQEALKDWLGE